MRDLPPDSQSAGANWSWGRLQRDPSELSPFPSPPLTFKALQSSGSEFWIFSWLSGR